MITNERQYRISKAQLSRLKEAAEAFDIDEAASRIGSKVLASAELEALRSEEEVLAEQIREYEALKSGAVTVFKAKDLDELPTILIRARIAQGLSQRQLADMLAIKEQQIQRYESDDYASASLRRLGEIANALRLNMSEVAELRQIPSRQRHQGPDAIDWALFPVKEMYRRHWFEGFSGSLASAIDQADILVEEFVTSAIRQPVAALHRKRVRSGSALDPYALLAWECRVLMLAKRSGTKGRFIQGSLDDDWLNGLVKESRFANGPARAKDYLDAAGISLVVEPHLSHTYLDGAALLSGGKPVIGLTLRFDRLDNFWFVLVHELVHIMKHLRKGEVEEIFDDMQAEPDELEQEADELAGQALIPEEVWEIALARYVRTEDSVKLLAEELKISPAIIAGRIRNEPSNYTILSALVGQGEVRKHFSEVSFGQ
ncbi:MAG: XRE family transcriptional regulator [Candidatus Sumerlaeota bacterium]|nr:XRE family transcriptional regulator [Candidatus Sumerlaeota bacterium]